MEDKTKAKFVHPHDLGLTEFPIWTREQHQSIGRSINGIKTKPNNEQSIRESHERKEFLRLKEKYGK